jgi:predicted  nucleic acid-binding Zn-ribbon protein
MGKIDFKSMSNNDIKLELKNLENEYEGIKNKIFKLVERMKELDNLFIEGKKELNNRSKGIF